MKLQKLLLYLILAFLCLAFTSMAQPVIAGSIKGTVRIIGLKSPTVVYLKDVPGDFPPPAEHAVMDQKSLKFVPHVLPILKGTTVDFPNSDTERHSVFTVPNDCKEFDLGVYPAGEVKQVTFDKTGEVPLLCNIHTEMSAYIVVLDNPYYAVTDDGGNYVIENVPPGKYTLTTYNERYRPVSKEVEVQGDGNVTVNLTLKRRR